MIQTLALLYWFMTLDKCVIVYQNIVPIKMGIIKLASWSCHDDEMGKELVF